MMNSPRSLSSKEMAVVKLVAQGLGNRAIAERLHKSEKTIKNQLVSVFAKRGFVNRTQVAIWYAETSHIPSSVVV